MLNHGKLKWHCLDKQKSVQLQPQVFFSFPLSLSLLFNFLLFQFFKLDGGVDADVSAGVGLGEAWD
jgi:hypothetical protein